MDLAPKIPLPIVSGRRRGGSAMGDTRTSGSNRVISSNGRLLPARPAGHPEAARHVSACLRKWGGFSSVRAGGRCGGRRPGSSRSTGIYTRSLSNIQRRVLLFRQGRRVRQQPHALTFTTIQGRPFMSGSLMTLVGGKAPGQSPHGRIASRDFRSRSTTRLQRRHRRPCWAALVLRGRKSDETPAVRSTTIPVSIQVGE
jgi:hypothetical protein